MCNRICAESIGLWDWSASVKLVLNKLAVRPFGSATEKRTVGNYINLLSNLWTHNVKLLTNRRPKHQRTLVKKDRRERDNQGIPAWIADIMTNTTSTKNRTTTAIISNFSSRVLRRQQPCLDLWPALLTTHQIVCCKQFNWGENEWPGSCIKHSFELALSNATTALHQWSSRGPARRGQHTDVCWWRYTVHTTPREDTSSESWSLKGHPL